MKSKYSNQDLINATFEIYNEFEPKQTKKKTKKSEKKIIQKPEPLLLYKEVKMKKKQSKNININKNSKIKLLNYKSPINQKISNEQRLAAYQKKKDIHKYKNKLRLNKIIKFESENYLLLHKIKNSDLKIIKMKRPNL